MMKLNKFCIFLITISLFLLISIGFACASDISDDADVQLVDDESDTAEDVLQETIDAGVKPDDVCSLDETDTVKAATNGKIIVENSEAEYNSGNFTFKLVDIDNNDAPIANKNLTCTIYNSAWTITTNDEGISILDNRDLTVINAANGSTNMGYLSIGKHPFNIKSASEDVICDEITGNLTIKKAEVNIAANPYVDYYGSKIPFLINVTNAKSGEPMIGIYIHVYIENTDAKDYYFKTDKNGNVKINISALVSGTYNMIINNNDTVNMNNTTIASSTTILKAPVDISVSGATTMYYKGIATKTITVTDKSTGKAVANAYMLVTFGENSYVYQTNDNGKISISISGEDVGKFKMTVTVADNRYDGKQVTTTITVKKSNAKITVAKLTTVYKSGKKWTIKLKDTTNNKAIANMKITLKVYTGKKYKTYTVKTNSKGVATFEASTLKKGTHKVILSMSSKGYTCKSVTSSIKINAKRLYIAGQSNKLKDCGQLILGAFDKKSKKLVSGIKMQIKIFTGKKYKKFNLVTKKSKILGEILVLIETNKFSVGKHKVTAKITSPNYYGSDKGDIVIPKSAKKYKAFTYVISKGKGKFV